MAYRFAGRDAEHACRWQGSGATEEELMAKVADHVKKKHNVQVTTGTIAAYVRGKVRQS